MRRLRLENAADVTGGARGAARAIWFVDEGLDGGATRISAVAQRCENRRKTKVAFSGPTPVGIVEMDVPDAAYRNPAPGQIRKGISLVLRRRRAIDHRAHGGTADRVDDRHRLRD